MPQNSTVTLSKFTKISQIPNKASAEIGSFLKQPYEEQEFYTTETQVYSVSRKLPFWNWS